MGYRPTIMLRGMSILLALVIMANLLLEGPPIPTSRALAAPRVAANGTPSSLRFDRASYNPGAGQAVCVGITVADGDENKDGSKAETITVAVVDGYPAAAASGDREQATLLETGPATGVFRNNACLPASRTAVQQGDGILQVRPGDIITALYQDPDNPTSAQNTDELFAKVDMSSDLALIEGGAGQGKVKIKIDPSILAQSLSSTPGQSPNEPARPVAMVLGPHRTPLLFGADQIVFRPEDDRDLADFVAQRNATVVETIDVVAAGPQPVPPYPRPYALVRLNPSQGRLDDLAYLAEMFGAQGEYVFSSEQAARLLAIILEEQLGGRSVMHNPVLWFFGAPVSREAGGADGFTTQPFFSTPRIGIDRAITFLDLIDRDRARSVNVAFLDGGFAGPADYPVGEPLAGISNPDYGQPFGTIPQGDCTRSDCGGSAAGPNPVGGFCAGGASMECTWHGTLSFSVAGATANNGFGAMGVAGHGRTSAGVDGISPLIQPMLFKVGLPYMTNLARAVNSAAARGAQVINISGGFACEPFLDIDICKGLTRTVLLTACAVLSTALAFLIPAPIAALLGVVACGSLALFFHLTGVADEDVLSAAISGALARPGLVIVASGPENVDLPILGTVGPFDAVDDEFMPCNAAGVICVGAIVGAIGGSLAPASINPIGAGIDIWAPGAEMTTTPIPGAGGTLGTTFGGTSASAPFITGVVALMKAANVSLTLAQIAQILNDSSTPLAAGPAGDCVRHMTGRCVGIVDAFEAVQQAASIRLTCTGMDEPSLHAVNDMAATADNLGIVMPAGPGSVATVPLNGDRAIHALPADQDWFRFKVPVLTGVDRLPTRVTLTLGAPAFGTLDMQLFEALDERGSGLISIGAGAAIEADLRNDRFYFIRVAADTNPALNDNCYGGSTLKVEVLWPPTPDRYEGHDSAGRPADVTESWDHEHWRCPRWMHAPTGVSCSGVFENGAAPRAAEEVWSMEIRNLSLGSITDSDFFRIRIPDPANPADGGHDDIRPSPRVGGDPEPLPECGSVEREDFGPPSRDNMVRVVTSAKLFIEIIPEANDLSRTPVATTGEEFGLYPDGESLSSTSDPLLKTIECPRSRKHLSEIIVSFGERAAPRARFATGGYTLKLDYIVEIERGLPGWLDDPAGPPFVGSLPCLRARRGFGSGGFIPRDNVPFCPPSEFGQAHLEIPHPFDPTLPGCIADGPGCGESFIIHWPSTSQPFDMSFAADADLSLRLFDMQQHLIGEALPIQQLVHVPSAEPQSHLLTIHASLADDMSNRVEKRLVIPQVAPGPYILVITGPATLYTVEFVPPSSPSYWNYVPLVVK